MFGRLTIALCVAASLASASELPHWVRFTGEERLRLEGFAGGGFNSDNFDLYLLQRFRLGMRLLPTSWLKLQFQAQDARVWWKDLKPYAPPFQDTWDLRLAYVELGDMETRWADLRGGRQELAFGDERLVGNTNWSNTARSFDAIRLRLHRGKYRLDAFAASVVVLRDGRIGDHHPGNNLHGLYGGLDDVLPNSTIEPYLLWRLSPRIRSESGPVANLDSKTLGLRWAGKLPGHFDYSAEMARQFGSLGSDRIHAWAGHWLAGYTFTNAQYTPRLIAEYNYATGDANPRDGKRGAFDQLYPTAHDKYGLADQVGWKNIHHLRSGIELKPAANWGLAGKYSSYWLADAHDALYNTSSTAIARQADGSAGRYVGQELDTTALYAFSKELQMGAGFGHIFPGTFLKKTTPGAAYNFPYLFLHYLR
ncbi:MAG: alginate export family protein [Bryobacteraceae bacterium]